MSIEKIFEEGVDRTEAVDSIRSVIRSAIEEASKVAIEEKYGKKKMKEEEEETDSEEEGVKEESEEESDEEEDESDEEEDESGEEEMEESQITEAIKVTASRVGGRRGTDEFTINRLSDLKKLAKSRQYDYMMVVKKNGVEIEYTIDPQGNLVEM